MSGQLARVTSKYNQLWWEFRVLDSFRWQAYQHDIGETVFQQRLSQLVKDFRLTSLVHRIPEELSPAERARVNLAVALLPHPDVLAWEDPLEQLSTLERMQLWSCLRRHWLRRPFRVLTAIR